ncbi:MAG TPA: hypothetical protein VN667_14865 [Burkholderiales bacterium]|nr:hypothetical protein [Burkholderiales bacterium]
MPANIDPIYTRSGGIGGAVLSAANTKSDGTGTIGTDIFLLATVDATNGGFVRAIEFWPTTSVSGTSTTNIAVGRVFHSTQSSGATTTSNTRLIGETTLGVQTPSTTVPGFPNVVVVNHPFPAGASILATLTVLPAANTAWIAVIKYGSY